MQGEGRIRTKPQDLAEIKQSQGGFLSALNKDVPKSDVGETQLTEAKNVVCFRDRVEARGGLKPTTEYKFDAAHDECLIPTGSSLHHDDTWDELFTYTSSGINVSGAKDITKCYGYTWNANSFEMTRAGNKLVVYYQDPSHKIEVIENRGSDFFLRPMTSDAADIQPANVDGDSFSPDIYAYYFDFTFVRKNSDGIVLAESKRSGGRTVGFSTSVLDGLYEPFTLTDTTTLYPSEYFDTSGGAPYSGEDNFYTHIRYYRTEIAGTNDNAHYHVGDYEINGLNACVGEKLDMNITDEELVLRDMYWADGYVELPNSGELDATGAFIVAKNDVNGLAYCPIMTGDNQKYLGWYNPFFQFSNGIKGEVTSIKDISGGYCLITTEKRSYTLNTVQYNNSALAPDFTELPIWTYTLNAVQLASDTIGIRSIQKKTLVPTEDGKLIALNSDGGVRVFTGYGWGADLAKDRVHAITKGLIQENNFTATGAYADNAYYLAYKIPWTYYPQGSGINVSANTSETLRLGMTEEAGYGWTEISGNPTPGINPVGGFGAEALAYWESVLGWLFVWSAGDVFVTIKGKLYVVRSMYDGSAHAWSSLLEYTGDKFDKKLNKDVVDIYSGTIATPVYESTTYYDITGEIEFPEKTGSSEGMFLYFMKANFFLRADRYAYKVGNETLKGYEITDSDLEVITLADNTFGMDARIGETDDIVASNDGFEPTSAVVLQRNVQDHRIRLTLRASAGGFQLTGFDARFKRHDRTEISETTTTETTFELNTGLYCLVNENLLNFAVGTGRASLFDSGIPIEGAFIQPSNVPQTSGTAVSLTTGPSGVASKAMTFSADSVYEWQAPAVTGSPTIMFWEKDFTGQVIAGWTGGELDQYAVTGIDSADWQHTAYVYTGSGWSYYINGVYQSATTESMASGATSPSIVIRGAGTVADVRMYNKNLTADELLFYYNNVINNEGDYV